ncbi:Phthiotriol/phenolphthiotriol dimycocerosates methyltransferase [Planctopirus ephydatiae]|uniref:Phthiotriol/phenolphthiotriol dimycocerosates methyltransferase n=2 Tax=Planctopirus ephydatiae TaxID=2528019 RepID=A0A518GTF8_9PLAN|nr:Phthiotriol/phenolphthiotriol dimycocerosates methyltransferase [Planctopirus ephydatiae]
MKSEILRCPTCGDAHSEVRLVYGLDKVVSFCCEGCGYHCDGVDGIVELVGKDQIIEDYPEMEQQTRLGARLYDMLEKEFAEIVGLEPDRIRSEYLDALELDQGSLILDVGIGTASEIRYLCEKNPEMVSSWSVCGVDISVEMLRVARKKLKSAGLDYILMVGLVENLPFQDNSFDVVFHTGAINEFRDQRLALSELLRVAKPGSRVVVTDEWITHENAEQAIGKELARTFPSITIPSPTPFEAIPPSVSESEIKTLWNGYGYSMIMRKSMEK